MGQTTYPCPTCGQVQRVEHQNGQEVRTSLCPACEEARQAEGSTLEAFVKKHRH